MRRGEINGRLARTALGLLLAAPFAGGCEITSGAIAITDDAMAPPPPDAAVDVGIDGTIDATVDAQVDEAAVDAPNNPQDAAPDDDATVAIDASPVDAGSVPDVIMSADAAPPGTFCSLPGSYIWQNGQPVLVPGYTTPPPNLTWLHVPDGFCAHFFATVPTARQLKFAPGGDLFVASSSTGTTGGKNDGMSAVVVVPDDNHDGVGDSTLVFAPNLPSVQGLMFASGFFYYQDDTIVRRVPFTAGDRVPSTSSQVVTNLSNLPQAHEHWPRLFDTAQDGTVYVTNGGSQGDSCLSTWPTRGAVMKIESDGTTTLVAKGFRNPIAMKCEADHDVCLVVELALDYSASTGGREKLVPVRAGDNWGFPCCATQNLAYQNVLYSDTNTAPDCSQIPVESDAFIIGHTPFGVDFSPANWPAPWNDRAFVTLHGVVGSWLGARVVGIGLDPTTGLPVSASELNPDSGAPDAMLDFATGWDDGHQDHGRPAPITFAADGRMFLGNDWLGTIVWIAPLDLPMP